MFLRVRLPRRVPTCHVSLASSFVRTAPLRYFRQDSVLCQTARALKAPSEPKPNFLHQSTVGAIEGPITNLDKRLHVLTDRQLVKLVRCIIQTRNTIPEYIKGDPKSGYSRATGAIYTAAYFELRRREAQSHLKGFPEVFLHVAKYCEAAGKRKTLDFVVEDVTRLASRISDGTDRGPNERVYRVLEMLIRILASSINLDSGTSASPKWCMQVIKLSKCLLLGQRPSGGWTALPANSLAGIAMSVVSTSSDWSDDITPLMEALLRCLEITPVSSFSPSAPAGRPLSSPKDQRFSALSWNCLRLIRILLNKDMYNQAFSFLQVLLQKGVIPTEAITSSESERDFHVFMVSVLMRCCALHGSPDCARLLLQGEDLAKEGFQEHYTTLANDLLSHLMTEDVSRLEQSSQLLKYMLSQNPSIGLDNALVQTFIEHAHRTNATKAAETVLETLELTSSVKDFMGWLFQGNILPWLLEHIVYRSENMGLGKRLAQELVASMTPISPYQRGDIIALCAAGGFLSETRALWERYAVGPDAQMVTGHTKCMVGIVNLFKKVSDIAAKTSADDDLRDEDMKETKETELADIMNITKNEANSAHGAAVHDIKAQRIRQEMISGDYHPDDDPAKQRSYGTGASENKISTKKDTIQVADDLDSEASGTPKAADDPRQSLAEVPLTPIEEEPSNWNGVSDPVPSNTGVAIGAENDEHYAFALKVLEAFQSAKEPLHRASHYDLNALARAADVLGVIRLSTRALQAIVDRKEVPDTRDLNVVIMAMATRDPSRAEEMLILMLQEGMHLNALSFSAVILGWLRRANTIRASRVYSRALRVGQAKLSSEAAHALLVACLDACCSPEAQSAKQSRIERDMHRTFLRQVYSLVDSEACPKSTIPRELRVRCIDAAIRLEDPGLAFYFWKSFMKTNSRRESDQEKKLRQAVAVLVKKTMTGEMNGTNEGSRMLSELGELA